MTDTASPAEPVAREIEAIVLRLLDFERVATPQMRQESAVALTSAFAHYRHFADRAEAAERSLAEVREVVRPFSKMAGELFARNWNASDVVIALDNPDEPNRLVARDFFNLRVWGAEDALLRAKATR